MKIIFFLCLLFPAFVKGQQQKADKSREDLKMLFQRSFMIKLPYGQDTCIGCDGFNYIYLKKYQIIELKQKGFKISKNHLKSEISIHGKLAINGDSYHYLIIHIESVSQGEFFEKYLVIFDRDWKLQEQFLLYTDFNQNSYMIYKDQKIKISQLYVEKTEKLPLNPYSIHAPKEQCYCKIIETDYQIANGKVLKIQTHKPRFGYYIFDGTNYKPAGTESSNSSQ